MVYKIFQFRFVLSICYRIFKHEYLHKRNACFSRQRTPLYCFSPCRNIDIYLRTKRRYRAFLGHLQDFLFLENRAGAWEKIQAWNCWYYLNNKKAQKEFTNFFHAEKYLNNLKRIFKHKKKDAFQRLLFFLLRFRISFLYSMNSAPSTKSAVSGAIYVNRTNSLSDTENQSNMVIHTPLQQLPNRPSCQACRSYRMLPDTETRGSARHRLPRCYHPRFR